MSDGNAVEDHAKVIGGGGVRAGTDLITGCPALTAFHHEVHRHIVRSVDTWLECHRTGQRDPDAFLYCGNGLFHLGWCDVIGCAQFVICAPFPPVGELVKIS